MPTYLIPLYIVIFIYGIVIGSFLNVVIYRIPKKESLVTVRSHCMSCGYQLRWFDLVPLFSWIFLKGKCRKCGSPISPQYPLIEFINGVLYIVIFAVNGFDVLSIIYCLFASALLALSVIDFRTFEIPVGINIFIMVLGLISTVIDLTNWKSHLIGALAISAFLYLLFVLSKGRAIGGGDVKLMAAAGLLLGTQDVILAFLLGCILGSIIHIIRMRLTDAENVLAMGPYLSMGLFIAMLWGDQMVLWYLSYLNL